MRKIICIAMLAISLTSVSVVAQNQDKSDKVKVENRTINKGAKKHNKGSKADKNTKADNGRKEFHQNKYEGLDLTQEQQNKLKTLDQKHREAAKKQRELIKSQNKEKKEIAKEQYAKEKLQRKHAYEAAQKEYLSEVKSIIGPDKYQLFLENFYISHSGHNAVAQKIHKQGPQGKKNLKDGKPGMHRMQPNKGARGEQHAK